MRKLDMGKVMHKLPKRNPPCNLWELWEVGGIWWIATRGRPTTLRKWRSSPKWKDERKELKAWMKTWMHASREERGVPLSRKSRPWAWKTV